MMTGQGVAAAKHDNYSGAHAMMSSNMLMAQEYSQMVEE